MGDLKEVNDNHTVKRLEKETLMFDSCNNLQSALMARGSGAELQQ